MKKALLLSIILISCIVLFAACGNVDSDIVNDAVVISTLKSDIAKAFDQLPVAETLVVDNEKWVISFSVENEVKEIPLSDISISTGSIAIYASGGSEVSMLALNKGLNIFSLTAMSGNITVNYTLRITRKAASTASSDSGSSDADSSSVHIHTYSDDWSMNEEYHWHIATCEHVGIMKDRGNHIWDAGVVTTAATRAKEGVITYTCTVCGATKEENTPQLSHDHSYGEWVVYTRATCVAEGEERSYCSECTAFQSRTIAIDADAHGHIVRFAAKEPTCSAVGWDAYDRCILCGYTTYNEREKLPHTEVIDPAVEATCTKLGKTEGKHCSVCGETIVRQGTISARGHDYGAFVTTKEPTCTAAGQKQKSCSRCTSVVTEPIAAKGHAYGAFVTTKEATCTAAGQKQKSCSRCTAVVTESIAATGHSYYVSATPKQATCTESGSRIKKCGKCNNEITETVPALGHNVVNDPAVEPTYERTGLTAGTHCSRCGKTLSGREVIPVKKDASDVILSRSTLYMEVGSSFTLTAIPVPRNATVSLTWTSNNIAVATVENGLVKAKAKGNVKITASGNGFQADCEIAVGLSKTGNDVSQEEDFLWSLNTDGSAYVVSGYTGSAKTVRIPDEHDALRVISIAPAAFKSNEYIQIVTLPNSIQSIQNQSFYGCVNLETINLPTTVKEIGTSAFENCYKLQSISIPAAVTNIGESAFERCLSLSSVTIENGVKTIGEKAFERCASLTNITLPNSITSVGRWAFNHAESLSSITLSTAMSEISIAAFSGCYALTSIELPSNIKKIGASAFSDCTNLASIRILGNISTFGSSAFYKCVYLTSIYWGSKTSGNYGDDNYLFYDGGINGNGIIVTVVSGGVLPTKLFEPVNGHQNLPYVIKILKEDGTVFSSSDYLPYLITGITFEDQTFAYDGKSHSITVSNLPEGASVYYKNNSRIDIGTHTATAYISIGYAVQELTATISVYPTITTQTNISAGGTYTTKNAELVAAGSNVSLTATTNAGYTWIGWFDGDTKVSSGSSLSYTFSMPATNKVYTARWCKVTIAKSNNSAGTVTELSGTYYATQEITISATTNNGYTWLGWYEGDKKVSDELSLSYTFAMPSQNKTFTAKWMNCPISLSRNDTSAGSVSGVKTTVLGKETTITASTNAGYTWIGWFDGETKVSEGSELTYTFTMPSTSKTYTAKWSKVTIQRSNNSAGTVTSLSEKYVVGDKITVTATTNNGYTWLGWYEGDEKVSEEGSLSFAFEMVAENKTYTAKWISCPISLAKNITDAGTVSGIEKTVIGEDAMITATTNPGYTWLGWYDGETKVSEGTSMTYIFTMTDQSKTYTAKWAVYTLTTTSMVNGDLIPVVLSFNLNGGTDGQPESQTISSSNGMVYPTTLPVRDGYAFTGWYCDASCTQLFDFSSSLLTDTTVYAGWKEMVTSYYSRTYINIVGSNNSSSSYRSFSNSGTNSSSPIYTYFTALTDGTYRLYYKNSSSSSSYATYWYIYNATQKSVIKSNSYSYSTSYNSVSFTAKAGDVIYVRNYRYNTSYTATVYFYVTGGSYPIAGGKPIAGIYTEKNEEKTSVGTVVSLSATSSQGYTWLGWYDEDTKVSDGASLTYMFEMPAENKTLSAKWMPCPITLEKNIQEAGSVNDLEVTALGSDATITATTNSGYIWLGWFDGDTKVSEGDSLTYTFEVTSTEKTFTAKWVAED